MSSMQRGRGRRRCRRCGGRVEFETDDLGRIVDVCAQRCRPRVLSPEEAGALRDALDRWATGMNARTDAERRRITEHNERLLQRLVSQWGAELMRYADARGRPRPTSPAAWELLRRDREQDAARPIRGGRRRVPYDAQDQYDKIRPKFGRKRGARMAACRALAERWGVTPSAVCQHTRETPGYAPS